MRVNKTFLTLSVSSLGLFLAACGGGESSTSSGEAGGQNTEQPGGAGADEPVDLSDEQVEAGIIPGSTVEGVDLSEVDLSEADLTDVQATDLEACPSDLPADWECLETEGAGLVLVGPDSNLSGVDLSGTDLQEVNLEGADLSGADLSGVDLEETSLAGADLSGADLTDVNLEDTDLSGADLSGTDLSEVDLSESDLTGVIADDLIACPEELPEDYTCEDNSIVGPGLGAGGTGSR